MGDLTVAANVATALCIFGAVTAFVLWAGRAATSAILQGRLLTAQLELNPRVEIKEAPLIANATNFGVPFLPLSKRWAEENRFGTVGMLERWDQLLIKAGLRSRLTPLQFMSASLFSAFCAALVMALLATQIGFGPVSALVLGLPAGALAGFYLQSVILTNLATTRIAMMEKRLPFATEFMLLAMEANASFPTAVEVYSNEMPDDPLAEEFRIVLRDIESGSSALEAFMGFQTRVGSESITAFILAVTTAVETGQPLKEVLEIQADATRQRRYQNAEEIAKKASSRAVFPLFIVFIALLTLLLGPMLIKVMRNSMF